MTKDKANEWLKNITGMKIKVDYWVEDEYIIPTGEWKNTSDNDPSYWEFWAIGEDGEKEYRQIREGFEEANKYGDKWVLVETFEDYLEMYYNE